MARPKEFNREVALDRAMHLFWRRGYRATSLPDLLEAMRIGRQSLYDTFGDKRALFLAALDRYEAVVGAALVAPLDEPGPVRPAVRRVFDRVVEGSLRDGRRGCLMANATAELAPGDREVADRTEASLRGVEDALCRALERARTTGELGPGESPRALARYLANALLGLRLTAKTTADRRVLEDAVRLTVSILG